MQPEQTNPELAPIQPIQNPQGGAPTVASAPVDITQSVPVAAPEVPVAAGPAAARFDMSSIYPTVAEHTAPVMPAPVSTDVPVAGMTQQPQPALRGFAQALTPPVSGLATVPQMPWQPISAAQATEAISVPMKNVAIVGIVGPLASTMIAYSVGTVLLSILWDALSSSFATGESTAGSGLLSIIINPGCIALYVAVLLFINVKITATYFDDLKIPRPVHAAGLGVLLTFATICMISGLTSGLPLIGFVSSVVLLLLMLISFYSGALWYPLGVKWSMLPIESPLKKTLLAAAGVYVAVGVGLFIRAMAT